MKRWLPLLFLFVALHASAQEACLACHEEQVTAFSKAQHQAQNCNSCHGNPDKHMETASAGDIRNPGKLKSSEADRTCAGCHLQENRARSAHATSGISCTSCHKVHEAKAPVTSKKINQQCSGCHSSILAEFQRPHSHPLKENAMSCTDCHSPHGTQAARSVRQVSANDTGCVACHGDKRGPFVFEHAPMRTDGCESCHQPHGSSNPKMLTRHEVRFQCLECHSNGPTQAALGSAPAAFHDLRSPRFRNCTTCHTKIHGSHVNRYFLR
jgi:DmsE family decaheme c-type cytochrome